MRVYWTEIASKHQINHVVWETSSAIAFRKVRNVWNIVASVHFSSVFVFFSSTKIFCSSASIKSVRYIRLGVHSCNFRLAIEFLFHNFRHTIFFHFELAGHFVCVSYEIECFHGMPKHTIFWITAFVFRFFFGVIFHWIQLTHFLSSCSGSLCLSWRLFIEQNLLASCDLRCIAQTTTNKDISSDCKKKFAICQRNRIKSFRWHKQTWS